MGVRRAEVRRARKSTGRRRRRDRVAPGSRRDHLDGEFRLPLQVPDLVKGAQLSLDLFQPAPLHAEQRQAVE